MPEQSHPSGAVFLSYASQDAEAAARICDALRAAGVEVWLDKSELRGGDAWDAQIKKHIHECALFIPVISAHTNARTEGYFRREWKLATRRLLDIADDAAFLLPVVIDETREADARVPEEFLRAQWTWLPGGETPPAFAQRVRQLLGGDGAPLRNSQTAVTGEIEPSARKELSAQADASPPRSASGSDRVSVCVLPFANMSGDPEQEYFSDGITEDIITDLSKVSALAVTSRNSSFVFKGKHVDVTKVARELKVSHVLEGSVRKAGGRVRITAQLVDGSSNDHVWAERYDRDLSDIFALQDEISQAIVKALKLKLLPGEKKAIEQRGTDNVEAYNLYLMARQLYVTGLESDARRAEAIIRVCVRITEIDPGYARAWALMALGQLNLRFVLERASEGGLAAAERALALDANLAEAHAVRGRVLADTGRHAEATDEIDIALGLDAESYEVNRSAAYFSYREGRLEDAIRYFEKATTLMETDINSAAMLLSSYRAIGDSKGVLRAARIGLERCEKVLSQDPNNGTVLGYSAYTLGALGDAERAKERMNRALLIDPDNLNMRYNFACVLVIHLNEIDAALDMLGPIFEKLATGFLNHAKIDPDFAILRDNPRFKAMIAGAEARLATE